MPNENPNPTPSYDELAAGQQSTRHGVGLARSIGGYLAAGARIFAVKEF